MSAGVTVDAALPTATDGEIAAVNLESARIRAWTRFADDPLRPGLAEELAEDERLVAEFLGDLDALDRLETLASRFSRVDGSSRAALLAADVASAVHRFADARDHLERAERLHGPPEIIERYRLTIDQACGVRLDAVLTARRIAARTGRAEDLVPLGAVLADLEQFAEADVVYRHAFHSYDGVSPFTPAYVCFQLGMLWGELAPVRDPDVAARWYRRAIGYVPGYVRARVHLAEIYASQNQLHDAQALLAPALSSDDPEVRWRLADVLTAQQRVGEAEAAVDAARRAYEALLAKHLLAFADHAAEFYATTGLDCHRALALAQMNVMNRPTRRAVEQLRTIAANCQAAGGEQ